MATDNPEQKTDQNKIKKKKGLIQSHDSLQPNKSHMGEWRQLPEGRQSQIHQETSCRSITFLWDFSTYTCYFDFTGLPNNYCYTQITVSTEVTLSKAEYEMRYVLVFFHLQWSQSWLSNGKEEATKKFLTTRSISSMLAWCQAFALHIIALFGAVVEQCCITYC